MEKVTGYIDPGKETISIWIPGDTEKDLRLVARIKAAFVAELNKRFEEEDWDSCRDVLEAGAEVAKFLELKTAEAERRAKDAAV